MNDPTEFASHLRRANDALAGNQLDIAIREFTEVIRLNPGFAEGYCDLGLALHRAGRVDEAIHRYEQSLRIKGEAPITLYNLANALRDKGQLADAAAAMERATGIRPGFAEALCNLGNILLELGEIERAIQTLQRATATDQNSAHAHYNLATALKKAGRLEESIAPMQRSIALYPRRAESYSTLGNTLAGLGRYDAAEGALTTAISLSPNEAQFHANLGVALCDAGKLQPAIAAFRRAIQLAPENPEFRWNIATALLQAGEFAEGWREYEWRFAAKKIPVVEFGKPRWNGEPLAGKRIILHDEQGYGDSIQFARYATVLANQGAKVVMLCRPRLKNLYRYVRGVETAVCALKDAPPFDYGQSLLSVPHILGTTLASIPANVPYITPDARQAERWQRRVAESGDGLKVGICWASGSDSSTSQRRSLPFEHLARLIDTPGVRWFSLQQGPQRTQASGLNIVDWMDEFTDFGDVELMAALDLIISVDTSTAHLAGAIGKPVWILLPFAGDWRWLSYQHTTTPWYPTARLFRQTTWGDWGDVIRRVQATLATSTSKLL